MSELCETGTPRCKECNKKLPLHLRCIQLCRCNDLFCSMHIHRHSCNYDYLRENQDKCKKNLIKVISDKVIPI